MDHDFELADYERTVGHIHDIYRLTKPVSYYASIRPTWNAREEEARLAAEEEKRRKDEEKQRQAAERAAAAKAEAEAVKEAEPQAASTNGKTEVEEQSRKKTPEEIKAQREAMLARKQQRASGGEADPGAKVEAPAPEMTPAAVAEFTTEPAQSPTTPDDLRKIEGIGPRIAALLQEAGITTFAQLAKTEVSQLKQILEKGGSRFTMADPTTWPEQAELAAAGKWAEFEALSRQLQGGRRQE
jgi:predicted flap endonuclease-1-like 5' DNA nuclease